MTTTAGALFRLRVLGAPELVDEIGRTPRALGRGKPLALLCYIAVRGEARRDEVVDLLWRGIAEDKARNAFRQALHRLRTALGDEIVPRDRERLRLGAPERLAIDLLDFERAAASGRLDQAVSLYTGDFLDGFDLREPAFDLWAEQERTRLRGRFRQVLHDAALEATARGRWEDANARTRRLLALTPFDPDAARLAATTLVSSGRRIEALELLREFAARVERELGIPPRDDLRALTARLARDATTAEPRVQVASASETTASLPFIGRQAELAQLLTLWRAVAEDAGALALIEGESGIGKSRLTRELAIHARSLGPALVLTGRERFAGAQIPFGIFAEALRPALRAPGVAGASAHLLAEAARILPEMRDTFDLPPVSAIDDEASRLRFFEGVAALLDAAAYEQKTLLILEDVQHLPPSSLDLLTYLVVRLAGAPAMLVLTVRPGDAPASLLARLRALASEDNGDVTSGRARTLVLRPLDSGDVTAALTESAATLGLPHASIPLVTRFAQGNPLRLVQAVRAAVAGEPLSVSPVPLRDVLLARFSALSSTQRRVFLTLALLGRAAPASLLSAAAHVPGSSTGEAVLVLEQLGWIERHGDALQVAHELAADVVMEAAGQASRAFLSGWIADALAVLPNASHAELARVYAMAGRSREAFDHARRGGFVALSSGAVAEAVQLFGLARTFASSDAEIEEVEAALVAAGSGRRRLGAGASQPTQAAEETGAWTSATRSGQTATAPVPARSSWWKVLFPHWQILLTAAIATAVIAALSLATRAPRLTLGAPAPVDTLIVVEAQPGTRSGERLAIGNLLDGFAISERRDRVASNPAWVDSVGRPWSHALAAPRGNRVALARADSSDAQLVVVTADRRDTLPLRAAGRDPVPVAWSPDGTRLLVIAGRRGRSSSFDTDLLALSVTNHAAYDASVGIDTASARAVVEASWSPDGAHIAWVARSRDGGQLDVFTSLADGTDIRNVSRSSADDYSIAWSPRGDLLAFTSTRDGNPEIYVADLVEQRLWRVTNNPAHDDRATFAPSGRFIAFESTRDGVGGVYVAPPLGGQSRPIAERRAFEIAGWRDARPAYVDRLRIESVGITDVGDEGVVSLHAFDRNGDTLAAQHAEWRVLDPRVLQFADTVLEGVATARRVRAAANGLARVVASVGRWRADTATIRVGDETVALLDERFGTDWERRWRALGDPAPDVRRMGRSGALVLRAPRSWDSGILSRESFALLPGLTVQVDAHAPVLDPSDAAMVTTVSLAAPESEEDIDVATPQLMRLASLSWNAESRRLVYAVGREVHSEPLDSVIAVDTLAVALRIEPDSTVAFFVGAHERWRSRLRLSGAQFGTRAQLWISGRATADEVTLSRVAAYLAPRSAVGLAAPRSPRQSVSSP